MHQKASPEHTTREITLRYPDEGGAVSLTAITFKDLVLTEEHLDRLLRAAITSPQGSPWLCVLPNGAHEFFTHKDAGETWAFESGFPTGHHVHEFLPNDYED